MVGSYTDRTSEAGGGHCDRAGTVRGVRELHLSWTKRKGFREDSSELRCEGRLTN